MQTASRTDYTANTSLALCKHLYRQHANTKLAKNPLQKVLIWKLRRKSIEGDEERREGKKKSRFQLHVGCVENRSLFISFKFEIKILLTFWLLFAATVKLSPHQKIFFHIIVFSITLCMSFLTTSTNFLFVLPFFFLHLQHLSFRIDNTAPPQISEATNFHPT